MKYEYQKYTDEYGKVYLKDDISYVFEKILQEIKENCGCDTAFNIVDKYYKELEDKE